MEMYFHGEYDTLSTLLHKSGKSRIQDQIQIIKYVPEVY